MRTKWDYHTCLAVAAEGILAPRDLAECTKDSLDSVFLNLQKPPKRPTMAGVLVEVQPYDVSAKLKMQLLAVLKIVKYYELTLCPLAPLKMSWDILKNFEEQ